VILDADLSTVTEFKDNEPHPGKDLRRGHFGFAGHDDPVEFRNIRIRRLKPVDAIPSWAQFRGANASGRQDEPAGVPAEIGPDKNVVWKVALPPGHSSPVVFGDRIFLTAERKIPEVSADSSPTASAVPSEKAAPGTPGAAAPVTEEMPGSAKTDLVTICLDRTTGTILWEQSAPFDKLEEIHEIGSRAQCTTATDGQHVVSFFGSSGMYCYDLDGKELWRRRMGPFNDTFGAGASPIIVDDRIILVQDHDTDSFLMSADIRTGETIWKTDRSEFPRSYSTPVILEVDGQKQIIVAGTLRVCGYDFQTGKEIWTVGGLSRAVCMTPVVSHDNLLFVAGWSRGGDVNETIHVDPFDTVIAQRDKNGNQMLEDEELEKGGDVQQRFSQVDRDKTGTITREEYEYYRQLFETARNVVIAIRPGGTGDVTKTHQIWESRKFVPFCASPLAYNGYLFTIKDGGIMTNYNARTGELLKTKRINGNASYYASPVGADGRVYAIDQRGKLSVIGAYADWLELWSADFGEDVYATPAIVGNQIFVRTTGHLYCFGPKATQANAQ
jgi:outer membrane protein assembly factor BamB